jgi:glucan phosphorylase
MQCVYCSQSVNGVTDHKPCQEAVWFANTENLEALKKQYDFVTNGHTAPTH